MFFKDLCWTLFLLGLHYIHTRIPPPQPSSHCFTISYLCEHDSNISILIFSLMVLSSFGPLFLTARFLHQAAPCNFKLTVYSRNDHLPCPTFFLLMLIPALLVTWGQTPCPPSLPTSSFKACQFHFCRIIPWSFHPFLPTPFLFSPTSVYYFILFTTVSTVSRNTHWKTESIPTQCLCSCMQLSYFGMFLYQIANIYTVLQGKTQLHYSPWNFAKGQISESVRILGCKQQ